MAAPIPLEYRLHARLQCLQRAADFQVAPGGYFDSPPGRDTQAPFDGFAAYIWSPQVGEPDRATFNQAAFNSVLEIIEISRANNLELIFIMAPSHPYADYYYNSIGAWGVIERWLAGLSGQATVYSFSQPNDWVDEPIGPTMTYWNDTFHFSHSSGSQHPDKSRGPL